MRRVGQQENLVASFTIGHNSHCRLSNILIKGCVKVNLYKLTRSTNLLMYSFIPFSPDCPKSTTKYPTHIGTILFENPGVFCSADSPTLEYNSRLFAKLQFLSSKFIGSSQGKLSRGLSPLGWKIFVRLFSKQNAEDSLSYLHWKGRLNQVLLPLPLTFIN
ncbi:hypothetical protein GOBAR_DD04490 [Gossypium barbadense]|nr:hypothetical protein GOBAR_DD04490 [Gossypium barbadense]